MKTFKGKAIYNPSGKAGEYSYWACNFYNGCSNGCAYCYLKKGVLANTLGGDKPTLKKCFNDEKNALEVFVKELHTNKVELQKHALFFTFTSDPFLPETIELNTKAILTAIINEIPVKVLTKRADFFAVDSVFTKLCREQGLLMCDMKYLAFGFTLTGCDEKEPNASTNAERIEAMKKMHEAGFKTWASIEPIIDFVDSAKMIEETQFFCDLYKIGLMSGKKYEKIDCRNFVEHFAFMANKIGYKVYFKDSILNVAGYDRDIFSGNCVGRDYNMFND